ncbi:MAG: uL15 family ribosomal protein [Candidatus Harrisonbacteria bacterium]|nr:uL15 family ribosomal protein [Candidatus Harrisonbacteria bacterium]
MQLHTLKPKHQLKSSKPRVGRGGKRGTYSGKGVKGQKSRSGHRIRPAERELLQRLPKLRGVKNKPLTPKTDVVNVGDLETFAKNGMVSKKLLGKKIKILGEGEIKSAITVEGLPVSESARKKIEAAGGKII